MAKVSWYSRQCTTLPSRIRSTAGAMRAGWDDDLQGRTLPIVFAGLRAGGGAPTLALPASQPRASRPH